MIGIMEHKAFTTREICEKLGIRERLLIYLADKRLVRPLKEAEGYASRRQYSAHNVLEIAVIAAMWGKASNAVIFAALNKLAPYKGNYQDLPAFLIPWGDDPKIARVDLLSWQEMMGNWEDSSKQSNFLNHLYDSKVGVIVNLHLICKEVSQLFELYELFPK